MEREELPAAFRAEMRPWRRGTTRAGILQKKLPGAVRTTVTFHLISFILLCIKPVTPAGHDPRFPRN